MTIYTLYNPITFDVLFAQEFDIQPENSTTTILVDSFVKPKYNPQTDTFYEGATSQEIFDADPRNSPDYYLTRESVGKSLVNEVSNELLLQYKEGKLTLAEVMVIEESLKEVIYSLRGGQFITANYKLAQSSGYSEELRIYLTTIIGQLIQKHYAQ